jgi:hypothetical protein
MKKLLLTFTLLFSILMFSTPSYAEWTKVSKNDIGNIYYVDFERIRKNDGYVYFWKLSDYIKPNKFGSLSSKIYMQVDCKLFRFKFLSDSYYKGPMGTGDANGGSNKPDKEWKYPHPNSSSESILKAVCNQ